MQANATFYDVPLGRRDGRVSNVSHTDSKLDVGDPIQELNSKFFNKSSSDKALSNKDLDLLIGTIYYY